MIHSRTSVEYICDILDSINNKISTGPQRLYYSDSTIKDQKLKHGLTYLFEALSLNYPLSAWCPLKGHTYLNKPAAKSWRFV